MKLFFKNEYLGIIENVTTSGMWANGVLDAHNNFNKFMDMFKQLTDEDIDFNESMFDKEWLLDNNWYIVNDAGESIGICVPAIYKDGDVNWRWR